MVSLIKYEFKSTARIFLPIYAALLAICFLAGISINTDSYSSFYGIQFLVIFALIVAIFVLTLVITIQRFSGNLLGDEGYLMFTLPVKVNSLILSKLITGTTWFILSSLVVGLGVLLMVGGSLHDMWAYILHDFDLINPLFIQNAGVYLLEAIASTLISSIASVLMIYASITVGHLFSKRRGLMAFVAFIGFLVIQGIFSGVLSEVFLSGYDYSPIFDSYYSNYFDNYYSNYDAYLHASFLVRIGSSALYSAAYFFIVRHVLSTNLNLE